jgi:hypothetical protein
LMIPNNFFLSSDNSKLESDFQKSNITHASKHIKDFFYSIHIEA